MDRLEADVRRELGRFGPPSSIGAIVEAWPAAVGDSIARHAWPSRMARDGTLHVATTSSAWAFELAQLAPTILERLRVVVLGEVPKSARFAPGPLPESPEPDVVSSRDAVPLPSAEQRAEAERLAAVIGDEDLRKMVARAAAASLAKAAADRPF